VNYRVLHIVYNLIRGGTEGQCARVAMGFRKRGNEHRVAVFQKVGFFAPTVERVCGPIYELRIRRVFSWTTWTEVVRLAKWLRSEKVALVHTWDADAAMFGSLAAKFAGIPYVTSRRDLSAIYPPWKLRWMRWADDDARRVVVNARVIGESLIAAGYDPQHIDVIPNLLDLSEFDRLAHLPFSQASRLPPGRIVVATCRLDPEKDVPTLIRAFALLAPTFPDLSLVIAGEGPERRRCENLADELNVADRVIFLGDVHDVPALLVRATLGALVPSRNEGQPNSVLEYFAARLPVVVTDCGGNRELVEGAGAGYVTPISSAEAVADAMRSLLRDPDRARQMGAAGRRRVEAEHGVEKVLDRFESLYAICLQSGA
jgi:glycosyltransferase involved in cell wall biosynthesis